MTKEYRQHRFRLPPDATEILLVRHGASAPVRPGERHPLDPDGHGDPELAPEGIAQAEAVADRLVEEDGIAAVFVTGLRRTLQTAEPYLARTGHEPTVVPELREVHLGDWEGGEFRIRMQDGDPVAWQAVVEERWDLFPNAESMETFAARVKAGVERVAAQIGPGATGAAFVHAAVIGEICRQATASRPFAFIHAENGSISRLVIFSDGRWLLRAFNETRHLP
ncbi:MAG TPA: histidine phosphatase family protein [Capillimicrobium sp.]|nr:histidine phosphatase family protein [Capillimicrobium sp.]